MRVWPRHLQATSGHDHRAVQATADAALASLCRYRSETVQPMHCHDYVTVSILLAGQLLEEVERTQFELDHPALGFKPRGCGHADRWGGEGGLMFTLKLADEQAEALERTYAAGWTRVQEAGLAALIRLALLSPSAELRGEASEDLLSLLEATAVKVPQEAPLWLKMIRDQIADSPGELRIAAASEGAGVHRAHLTNMFRRHYGVPPSVYRRRVMVSRALHALAQPGARIGDIAADLGFSDQAHLTRCLKAQTGLTPSDFRSWLNDGDDIRSR